MTTAPLLSTGNNNVHSLIAQNATKWGQQQQQQQQQGGIHLVLTVPMSRTTPTQNVCIKTLQNEMRIGTDIVMYIAYEKRDTAPRRGNIKARS